MKKYLFAPSLLSADFFNLEQEIDKCLDNKVKWIHYDVMDFHFVPNLTFGAKVLQDITDKKKRLNIDIHFMVDIKGDYNFFFKEYLAAKPKMMTMHLESLKSKKNVLKFLTICHQNGVSASIAISPKTPVKKLLPYLKLVDNVLVMTVEPGFGGQKFLSEALPKIVELNDYRLKNNLTYTIEVDGGINKESLPLVKAANVDIIVAGSYFFNAKDPAAVVKEIESAYGIKK